MTKILVITSLFPNKIKPALGIFIKKRMFAYAQKKGCSIMVVSPVPYYPDLKVFRHFQYYSQVPRREILDGITVYHPRYIMIPKMSMQIHGRLIYWGIKKFVQKLHGRERFDLIDSHFIFPDGQAAVLLGELLNLPVVVSARGSDIHEFTAYPSIRKQIQATLQKSSHVISVCKALKNLMVGMGIPSKKISVIPNGIDTERFYPVDKKKAKKSLKLAPNKRFILSVGALIPLKGHDLTIKAVSQVLRSHPELQLYIIGSGPEKHKLESLIFSLNLQNSVFLLGQIPNNDLVFWYNAADLFCLSSQKEGWPNVLTEALSCGTPVVATKVFGAPEIVQSPAMGLLVKRTVDDIANGMNQALTKAWVKNIISQQMSKRTWDVVAEECSQVFTYILDR